MEPTTVVGELLAKIAELEKRTIKWNKYPDIKPYPNDDSDKLIFGHDDADTYNFIGIGDHQDGYWHKDEDGVVTHWAEMPEGPEEL